MDTSKIISLFSENYIESRKKFIDAAEKKGLVVDHYVLDLKGINGEELATDVVYEGSATASKLILIISGVHGPEGFSGSAVQTGLLSSTLSLPEDTAILYVHAINPYGFSYLRRVNEDNVDLNRNFINFNEAFPINTGYAEIDHGLLPVDWPVLNDEIIENYRSKNGDKALQCAMGLGQHAFSDGMFFGGVKPTWSNKTIRAILNQYKTNLKLLVSIDIHTGLGPYGLGEKIFASVDQSAFEYAEAWWGKITNVHTGTSASIPMTGPIQTAITEEYESIKHIGLCLEYGTFPMDEVSHALRADHWAYRYQKYDTAQGSEIRQNLKNAFYPNESKWKILVWEQAHEIVVRALSQLKDV